MGLALSLDELTPHAGMNPESGLIRRATHGKAVSMAHVIFPPGYCSAPHGHESEELAQVAEGEISIFMDGREYRVGPGDCIRIPAMTVHWKRNRSESPAVVYELHNPPLADSRGASLLDNFEEGYGLGPTGDGVRFGQTFRASRHYADDQEAFPEAPEDDPLRARGRRMWEGLEPRATSRNHGNIGTNRFVRVGGESMSILYGERIGFKMRPHFHVAEQISYVLEGEVWTFMDDRVYLSRPGEFIRAPSHVVHWALVEPGTTAWTFEVHSPVQTDPVTNATIFWLVPPHRVASLDWVPEGFITDALPVGELAGYEAGLIQAAKETLRLQSATAGPDVTLTGARRR